MSWIAPKTFNNCSSSRYTRVSNALAAFLYSFLYCSGVFADTAEKTESASFDDIFTLSLEELLAIPVSSASLLPEKSQRSASTTSTVSRLEWQSRSARRLADVIEPMPGTMVLPFRFGAEAIAVRGFGGTNLPRGLSLRWDEVPLTGFSNGAAVVSVPNIDVAVLDKVEMVRGPASALYGSDAFHGVLSLYSVDRSPDALQMSVADDEYYSVGGHAEIPGLQSVRTIVALAASGQGDQQQAYRYTDPISGSPGTGYRENQYESQTGVIKLASVEHGPISFRWGLYWNQFDGDRFIGPGRSQTPGSSALVDQDWSGSNTNFQMTNAAINIKLPSGLTAEVNSFYWRSDVMQETQVPRSGGIGENRVDVGDTRYGINLILRQSQSILNTQWAASLGHDNMAVDQGHTTLISPDDTVLANVDDLFADKTRTIDSVLMEFKTAFWQDSFKLVYGGRIEHYSDFGTQKTPRLGFIYTPERQWTYKLLYGEAFRAPTAFEIYGVGNFKGNRNLDPEIIKTLEWAATTYRDNWTAGITLFASHWQNGIVRVPSQDPNFRLEFQNVDENRSQGAEATFQFRKQPWLVDLSTSYIRSENVTQDQQYQAFPRVIFNLGVGYRTSGGTQVTLTNRVHLKASAGIDSEFGNASELPTYWRVDLSLEKNVTDRLKLNAGIRNLFDRDNYLPSLFNAEEGVPMEDLAVTVGLHYRLQ